MRRQPDPLRDCQAHRPFATFTFELRSRIDSRCKNGARAQLEGAGARLRERSMRNRQPADQRMDPYVGRTGGTLARSPAERLEPTRPPARPRRRRRDREPRRSSPLLRFLNGLLTFVLLLMLLVGRRRLRCSTARSMRRGRWSEPRSWSSPRAKARTRSPRGWSARASSATAACSSPAICGRKFAALAGGRQAGPAQGRRLRDASRTPASAR